MYGTRDAAENWEYAYVEFMESVGFIRGTVNPCWFKNNERDLYAEVHGDDFTMAWNQKHLDWFMQMMKKRFEVKHKARLSRKGGG